MSFGKILIAVSAVGAVLVGAFVPDQALLWMGLCVAGVGVGVLIAPFV